MKRRRRVLRHKHCDVIDVIAGLVTDNDVIQKTEHFRSYIYELFTSTNQGDLEKYVDVSTFLFSS